MHSPCAYGPGSRDFEPEEWDWSFEPRQGSSRSRRIVSVRIGDPQFPSQEFGTSGRRPWNLFTLVLPNV